jgi:hypothetical protein
VWAVAGRRDKAQQMLSALKASSRQQYVSPFLFAIIYIGLGDHQEALASLEKAHDERHWLMCVLKTEPGLDPLRPDARFQALLRRMNFPA